MTKKSAEGITKETVVKTVSPNEEDTLRSGIVVNRMFVGNYLMSNLGHEIINLFQADNGKHYIYLNAYGNFDKTHLGKIGTMLMVKSVGRKVLEVIGMAKNIESVDGVAQPYIKYQKDQENQIFENQIKLIHDEKITYGGIPLNEIFNDAEQQTIFVTYRAEAGDVFIPKDNKRIFIQYGKYEGIAQKQSPEDTYVVLEGYKFPSSSLKSYFYPEGKDKGVDNETQRKDYEKVLTEIINNEELWTADRDWKVKVHKGQTGRKPNLFEICQIQNDENRISNALAYFMMQPEYKELWKDFFHRWGITLSDEYSVEREADARIKADGWDHTDRPEGGRIDLLIKDKGNIIVIENKIKSGINSKSSDETDLTQLDRYVNFTESIIESIVNKEKPKPYYLILTPNYNVPDSSRLNRRFSIVTYKDLYDFLSDEKYREKVEQDNNFKAFRDTLFRHTLPTHNAYLFYEMMEKFQNRIKEKKIP